jgi:hypothetical protein
MIVALTIYERDKSQCGKRQRTFVAKRRMKCRYPGGPKLCPACRQRPPTLPIKKQVVIKIIKPSVPSSLASERTLRQRDSNIANY